MVFSSVTFLYYFLPLMLLSYYLTPSRYKNVTLLLGSLFFYFTGEPIYISLLVISTIVDYSHSLIIQKHRGNIKAKMALVSSITINLSMLFFFKYSDFFITNVNRVFGTEYELLSLSLPIGISFFTFQTMSYTIDVYRNEASPQKNILNLGTYVALFPQLIAGPIVRYKTIADELNSRTHSYNMFAYGVRRFIIGLAKKVILANTLGELSIVMRYTSESTVLSYWIVAITFALQIYYDFSGYSDMAIGLGSMFGFHFPENFNYPYISKSISEFWNRWHMSLGQWFRDYVYIPLGGNRKGLLITIRNIAIIWLLTGFWHGANWNFVIWGGFLGTLIILEKIVLLKLLKKTPQIINHIYVVIMIVISFVIFNNESLGNIAISISAMFGGLDIPLVNSEALYHGKSNIYFIILACIGVTPIVKKLWTKCMEKINKQISEFIQLLVYSILLVITTSYLIDASFNPFLYFRF